MNVFFQLLSTVGASQGLGNSFAVSRDAFEAVNGHYEKISAAQDVNFLGASIHWAADYQNKSQIG